MKKTVVFSDLHGQYDLWTTISNYYDKDDTLICLGDVVDRGPNGIKILQEMMKDPRIIFIIGNHEVMLLDYIEKGLENLDKIDKQCIEFNESEKTVNDFNQLLEQEQKEIIYFLQEKAKKSYIYINKDKKNVFLSHAGIDFSELGTEDFNKLIWNRDVLKEKPWDNKYKYWYIVHGHSPVQAFAYINQQPQIYRYENNHKIDIDMGCFISHKIAVLDLDTLQPRYFSTIKESEEVNDDK